MERRDRNILILGPLLNRLDERAQKRIAQQPEIPTLEVQMEEIARASGVTQLSIAPGSPGSPQGCGDYWVLPITMTFEGACEELQDFLRRVDSLARLVTVNDVTSRRVPTVDPEHSRPMEGDEAVAEKEPPGEATGAE